MNAQQATADIRLRRAAVQAAERGWAVFPTRPGGKEPRKGLSWPRAASSDPAAVARAGWRPGENYGVAAKRSGLVIIDLDMPKPGHEFPAEWRDEPGVVDGRDVLATLAERVGQSWPETFTVQTPSGGWHLYFRAPRGRAIGNRPLGALVDIRGGGTSDGGYVLGPGSALGGHAYEVIVAATPAPLPGWIADLLDPPARSGAAPLVLPGRPDGMTADGYARLRGVLDRLAAAQPGDRRNALLHWSACRFAELVAVGEISEAAAESALLLAADQNGHVAKHGERATKATIRSGMRQGAPA